MTHQQTFPRQNTRRLRERLLGLFIMSGQGLRTFSGVTVGLLGSYIGIHWSLGFSTGVLLVVMLGLLAFTSRSDREESLAARSTLQ